MGVYSVYRLVGFCALTPSFTSTWAWVLSNPEEGCGNQCQREFGSVANESGGLQKMESYRCCSYYSDNTKREGGCSLLKRQVGQPVRRTQSGGANSGLLLWLNTLKNYYGSSTTGAGTTNLVTHVGNSRV